MRHEYLIIVFSAALLSLFINISPASARCDEANNDVRCGQFSPGMKQQNFLNMVHSNDAKNGTASPVYLYRFCAFGDDVQISVSNRDPDMITVLAGNCSDIDIRPSAGLEITAVGQSPSATIQYSLVTIVP